MKIIKSGDFIPLSNLVKVSPKKGTNAITFGKSIQIDVILEGNMT